MKRPARRSARESQGMATRLKLRRTEDIARIMSERTGRPMTAADVRHVLTTAHAKIARALATDDSP